MKYYSGIARKHVLGSPVSQKVYVTETRVRSARICTHGEKRELEHHILHSPDGFAWGYHGSGPAELARCILWDFLGHAPHRLLYQKFKVDYVAIFPSDQDWVLSEVAVDSWLYLNRELTRKEHVNEQSNKSLSRA